VRQLKKYVDATKAASPSTEFTLIPYGDKAISQLKRIFADKILFTVNEVSRKPMTFVGVSMIADKLLKSEFDLLTIYYNRYASALSFIPTPRPIPSYTSVLDKEKSYNFEFEDDNSADHLRDLYEFTVASVLFSSIIENNAAELGSRMTAMDNATRNAAQLLNKLSVYYNRARQAAITTELTEIISGASSVQQTAD